MQFNAVYHNSTLKNGNSLQEVFSKYICMMFLFRNPNQSSMQPGSPMVISWWQLAVVPLCKNRRYHTSQTKSKSSLTPILTSYSYITNHIYLQLLAHENPRFFSYKNAINSTILQMQQILQFLYSSLGAKMKSWSLSLWFATELLQLITTSSVIQPPRFLPC